MKKLLLIDANSIIHRSFHALPPFTGPDGRPTGALYGISAMLLSLLRPPQAFETGEARGFNEEYEYAAALFDRPEPTFRDAKYKEYKAQRPPTAPELISQIIEAQKLFESFGIKVFEKAGYEADDLIATLAEKFRQKKSSPSDENLQVVILTGDRDTLQLVDDDRLVVKIFNKGVSDTTVYNEAAVEAKYGLKPNQLIDYKALVGDASDNIKGVPGIGPKTACEMLQKFGTLENFIANAPADAKGAEKLKTFKKEAELAKELVTLERHAPIEIGGLEDLTLRVDKERVKEYFATLGSATLLKRLEKGGEPAKAKKAAAPKKEKPNQGGLF